MDGKPDAVFGGDRHHFLQELNEVGAHVAGGDIVETGNLGADFFARVAVFAAGQTGDDVPFERQDFIVAFFAPAFAVRPR